MVVGSIRKSQVCEAQTAKKQRCRNRTARGKMCWVHLKKLKGLRVKKSAHGLGLFTTRDIHKNKIIVPYKGEAMTKKQVAKRYPKKDGRYVICTRTGDRCIDARNTTSGVGRFANTAKGSKKKSNARFADRTLNIKSRKKIRIKAGAQILVSYGKGHTFTF